jgi:hypothetical protein
VKGKTQYIRRLKALKAQAKKPYDIRTWASRMVYQLRLPLKRENKEIIEKALDAAYHHDKSVRAKSVASRKFNFKKHANSWLDSNQLFYLADPNFIFVTMDKKLIGEVTGSSQAKRVILFQQLLRMAQNK